MLWQIPVGARVVVSHVLLPYLFKKVVGLPGRTTRLVWQFGLAFVFSLVLALVTRKPVFLAPATLSLLLIGAINSFGAYSQWRAMDISLSKNSLLTQGDDMIALTLGVLFLTEERESLNLANPRLLFGIVLTLVATIVFSWVAYRKGEDKNKLPLATSQQLPSRSRTMTLRAGIVSMRQTWQNMDAEWRNLLQWAARYSVIWGVAEFLARVFAIQKVPLPSFLIGWYGGAFLGSLAVRKLAGKKEAGEKLSLQGLSGILGISQIALGIWLSQLLNYAALLLVPLTVVRPIYWGTEIVFPVLIGLLVFREGKSLSLAEKVVFGLALVGVVTILFAF